ncbi:PIN domain-containing protein [Streptomyces pseudogriseolus]|uniref:PIN domain-containing protein n=1 Tax=Streptomyces pseudogriseolus TaxID=36817 RepID=UPI003FA32A51
MIIFDTNAVNQLSPSSPRADLIRKLRQSKHHRVAVPWMVLEEMAAHQARLYPEKYHAVLNSLAKLRAYLPWAPESSLEPLDLERLLDHWRDAYREIFEVIETSDAAIRRGFQREAMALPPAKRVKDRSEGGRDATIWFSVLEFLEQNPDEQVWFVTNNSSDFGDGSVYRYPMNEDIRGLEDRLTLLKDFNQVVSHFTKEVSGADAEAAAAELLKSAAVRDRVAQTAMDLSSLTGFVGLGDGESMEEWYAWLAEPEVELLSVTDVTGHEIESDVWYTANAQWVLYGPAVDEVEAPVGYIACVWSMKVLFSARDDAAPTLLTSEEPSPPDTCDESCMRILEALKKRVADIVARAKRRAVAVQTPAERLIAEQFASSLAKLDTATNQLALQAAARQAALINGPAQRLAQQMAAELKRIDTPAQRLAQQAAEHLKLVNTPAQRLARKMVADQLALIDSPLQRAARQVAASMPKLDLAADLHQPSGRDEAVAEGVEQTDSSDAPEARGAGPEDAPADEDNVGE